MATCTGQGLYVYIIVRFALLPRCDNEALRKDLFQCYVNAGTDLH